MRQIRCIILDKYKRWLYCFVYKLLPKKRIVVHNFVCIYILYISYIFYICIAYFLYFVYMYYILLIFFICCTFCLFSIFSMFLILCRQCMLPRSSMYCILCIFSIYHGLCSTVFMSNESNYFSPSDYHEINDPCKQGVFARWISCSRSRMCHCSPTKKTMESVHWHRSKMYYFSCILDGVSIACYNIITIIDIHRPVIPAIPHACAFDTLRLLK